MIPWMTPVGKTEERTQQDPWAEVTQTHKGQVSKRRVLSSSIKQTSDNGMQS